MKIEVWSDFVCPFCYIGKRKLEHALERFPQKDQVEVVYKSFELDPNSSREAHSGDIHDMLAGKYGMSREQAMEANRNVGEAARAVGLNYDFDRMSPTNTFDAHRLAHFAAEQGLSHDVTERLLQAYFTEGVFLGDHEELAKLAAESGLDRAQVLDILNSDAYSENVRADEEEAVNLGVRGVPFFVLDGKFAVSGAQPDSVFDQALERAWGERPALTVLGGESAEADGCADGSCAVPQDKPDNRAH
ncbi:DsbA family oxidoreductase [Saccharibacillus sp. CPCC 101409]|uniref:DsbA family oxidoreductase n=1 Tax=Saccharibacillus sp. CPCC 101409 TaxID=3058041 RepID=UPI002672458C|nr:DsbA family oxidoreductase [Saccharibacillus sp. CPCC 101409]MDO3410033.1 DsbA family oxidoreductase [Saccharibacillus sp. CPCC 101409]